MQQLRPGLWTWTAPHPEWTEDSGGPSGWERVVRSYAFDAGDCLVLFDPQSPPSLLEGLIESQDVVVVLTCKWHARSSVECVERFGATVYAPKPAATALSAAPYELGDTLPGGVVAQAAYYPEDIVLWIPAHHAVVFGDVALVREHGRLEILRSWAPEGVNAEQVDDGVRPLLNLPLELVLPTHGDPILEDAHEALRRALDA
jgi:glyoxylase-like metal-dependent hydrolase (beta-lactamase superfamily II)